MTLAAKTRSGNTLALAMIRIEKHSRKTAICNEQQGR